MRGGESLDEGTRGEEPCVRGEGTLDDGRRDLDRGGIQHEGRVGAPLSGSRSPWSSATTAANAS